jgi:hypothetical protein
MTDPRSERPPTSLVRDVRMPAGVINSVIRRVGWRDDAVSDQECPTCWGTGRVLRYGRSLNCAKGIHASCKGHQDPRKCGCFCHQAAAVTHGLVEGEQP